MPGMLYSFFRWLVAGPKVTMIEEQSKHSQIDKNGGEVLLQICMIMAESVFLWILKRDITYFSLLITLICLRIQFYEDTIDGRHIVTAIVSTYRAN